MSEQGYECFEPADKEVIQWLNSELLGRMSSSDSASLGSHCYHLKGRGGVKQAFRDLSSHLSSGRYRYIIRSDAKGYYAHIRHHKLIALLKDQGYSRDICHVVTELCQRTTVRGGYYSECLQGIPLGCAASPALAAIYLSPLDHAMSQMPGVTYIRYMDDWVILCESRWKLRRAVKLMHQVLHQMGQRVHPDKTFIGKIERGFDFLGVEFAQGHLRPSSVSLARLQASLSKKFSSCTWLYEQGKLRNLESIKCYLNHWLAWAKGGGLAAQTSLAAIAESLSELCQTTTCRMTETFSHWIRQWVNKQQIIKRNENKKEINGHSCLSITDDHISPLSTYPRV